MTYSACNIFWFRRDLRLDDNRGLCHALRAGKPVMPIFIFDSAILKELNIDDRRVSFIFDQLTRLNKQLEKLGSRLFVFHGNPLEELGKIVATHQIQAVFANEDYESYALTRDAEIDQWLKSKDIRFFLSSDQLVLVPGRVMSASGKPYSIYTPFAKAWKAALKDDDLMSCDWNGHKDGFVKAVPVEIDFPAGFKPVKYNAASTVLPETIIQNYAANRDFPAKAATSRLGVHLRFGTVSIRAIYQRGAALSEVWGGEIIWREFFMHVLHHFPHVEKQSFRKQYDAMGWRNNEAEFKRWCEGQTGYPLVDAGMRELAATGHMHNRVRMVTAGFLTKHLLIDWRWGEAWFAQHLMDFELASNNGNWQWAAGTGCDAAPYFRIFNPTEQARKFDPNNEYIRQWVPEFDSIHYAKPLVEHRFARARCLEAFKKVQNLHYGEK